MKLGVTYNIFDGEEMLPFSLKNLRPMVDFICVVYQNISNFGNSNDSLEEKLTKLKEEEGLIDYLYEYEPEILKDEEGKVKWQNGTFNELEKRNIGLKICRANGCDVFMTIDCDELYDESQFEFAKKDFELGGYDTSFCKMRTYYKLPTLELFPFEEYYAPLFYRIKKETKFSREYSIDYPVLIDPTRRVKAGYSRVYDREEIEMYHYAYVRKDLISKTKNSSSQTDVVSQKKVCYHYDNFKDINDSALFIGLQTHTLREVENKFNIEI